MIEPTDMLSTLGDPRLALALLVLAVALLEVERWWTRRRRQRGRRVGPPAYALDALALASAVLCTVSALALLLRGVSAGGQLAGYLLSWAAAQARAHSGALAAIVLSAALAVAGVAFLRGQLRQRRAAASAARPSLGEQMTVELGAVPASVTDSPALRPALPQPLDQPSTAIVLAPQLDAPAITSSQLSPPIVVASQPAPTAVYATSVPAVAAAQAEEPSEILAPLSMLGHNRRPPMPSTPSPQSFLPSVPEISRRRSRLPLALATLALIALIGGGLIFRQQVAGLLPALRPATGEATSTALSVSRPNPTISSAPTSAPAGPTAAPLVARHVKSNALNLRARPGTDQPVLTTLAHGASVLLLDETATVAGRTWVRVRAGQQEGWVSQDLLE
jgi:hypothetical protein